MAGRSRYIYTRISKQTHLYFVRLHIIKLKTNVDKTEKYIFLQTFFTRAFVLKVSGSNPVFKFLHFYRSSDY